MGLGFGLPLRMGVRKPSLSSAALAPSASPACSHACMRSAILAHSKTIDLVRGRGRGRVRG